MLPAERVSNTVQPELERSHGCCVALPGPLILGGAPSQAPGNGNGGCPQGLEQEEGSSV